MNLLNKFKRHTYLIFLNFLLLLFFLGYAKGYIHWQFLEQMENYAYDARVLLSIKKDIDPRIVIVDIDEKSLAIEGRWPWSRNKMASLVDKLFDDYNVNIVGFDIVFAEPDDSSGLTVLEVLANNELSDDPQFMAHMDKLRHALDYDLLFADSISNRPVLLGYYFNTTKSDASEIRNGVLPKPVFSKDNFKGLDTLVPQANGYGANLPELQDQAIGGGHFNPTIDEDGVVRRVPMLYEFDGYYYASLSLAIIQQLLEVEDITPIYYENIKNIAELEWLKIGHYQIPVDNEGQVLVPYRGKQGSFPYVSATDVLNDNIEPTILQDTYVLIGTSAPGLFDLRSTPVDEQFTGVEIQANLIAGMLDERIKQVPVNVSAIEFLILLISGLITSLLLPLLTPVWAGIATFIIFILIIGFNIIAWQYANLVLPIASTVIMIFSLFLVNMSYGFFIERRRKTQITGLFGQYVPPELVDEMSDDPAAYSLEAEDREMSVLFSDVRGFTTISEGLNPKELATLMNAFLTPLTQVIHEHRGTIDKYMGDAIMAFWGAPIHDPDHAQRAVEAALGMINKMHDLHDEFLARGWPELRIGVGINTGLMNVGNMGSKFRMAYTVLGDAVNLGSRLEGITKQYSVDIIVSETTKEAIPGYAFRQLDQVRVKGKEKPITIYEPMGKNTEIDQNEIDELELYEQALKNYRAQKWNEAEALFKKLQKMFTERPLYEMYINRLNYFQNMPPGEDWDGVFTFSTK